MLADLWQSQIWYGGARPVELIDAEEVADLSGATQGAPWTMRAIMQAARAGYNLDNCTPNPAPALNDVTLRDTVVRSPVRR